MSILTCTAADDLTKLCTGYRNRSFWRTSGAAAMQGYFAGDETSYYDNRIGVIYFDGLSSLKGNRINSISLSITFGSAGGSWNKNLIIRKSMIQGEIDRSNSAIDYAGDLTNADAYKEKIVNPDSGKTCYDYDQNILGILTGKFKSNTVNYTLSNSSNSDLYIRMKEYIESGNNVFVIYNSDVSNMYTYSLEGTEYKYAYEYLSISSITITINYSIPYTITFYSGGSDGGYFANDRGAISKTITKWEGDTIKLPSIDSEYIPIYHIMGEQFTILGETGTGVAIEQIATKKTKTTFDHWNSVSPTGDPNIDYFPGDDFDIDADISLYPSGIAISEYENNTISGSEWWNLTNPDSVVRMNTIYFNGNGGICNVDNLTSYSYNKYSFDGWYSDENGAGVKYSETTGVFYENTQIYANWTSKNITDEIVLPGYDDVTRIGYEFIGWNTARDGSGIMLTPNSGYIPSSDITLYAIYSAKGLVKVYDPITKQNRDAIPLIFSDSKWSQTIPNIFNGASWKMGG